MKNLVLWEQHIAHLVNEAAKLHVKFTSYSFKVNSATGEITDQECYWTNDEAKKCFDGYRKLIQYMQDRRDEIVAQQAEIYMQEEAPLSATEKATQKAQYFKALIDLGYLNPKKYK